MVLQHFGSLAARTRLHLSVYLLVLVLAENRDSGLGQTELADCRPAR